jgi:hypothetical protein
MTKKENLIKQNPSKQMSEITLIIFKEWQNLDQNEKSFFIK